MLLKICSGKYHATNNNNKGRSELVSLITEPLPLDHHEQFSAVPIKSSEEMGSDEQDKHETANVQVCRICYSSGDLQSLINPCECSGTMGILHQNCLERWLEISNTTKCEICQHEFEVIRYPKSLFYFLTNPLRPWDIRYLINDLILFIFLTTIISWLSVLNISKIRVAKTFYDSISYIILPLCVSCIYIIWCWVSFRYHIQVIKEWRSVNQLIRVIHQQPMKINSPANLASLLSSSHAQHYPLHHDHTHALINGNEENIFPDIRILK